MQQRKHSVATQHLAASEEQVAPLQPSRKVSLPEVWGASPLPYPGSGRVSATQFVTSWTLVFTSGGSLEHLPPPCPSNVSQNYNLLLRGASEQSPPKKQGRLCRLEGLLGPIFSLHSQQSSRTQSQQRLSCPAAESPLPSFLLSSVNGLGA